MNNNLLVSLLVWVSFLMWAPVLCGCSSDGWPQFRGGNDSEEDSSVDSDSTESGEGSWEPYKNHNPDPNCPLGEMVFVPGSSGSFEWGADWSEPTSADLYNWMFAAQYSEVDDLCWLAAPFPAWPGYPYFETDDPDDNHGNSYGDTLGVLGSPILADLGLRLPEFREAAWFQLLTEGDVDLGACGENIRSDGMFAHPECKNSLGVEIGAYAFWAIRDSESAAAHNASVVELSLEQPHSYYGLPNNELDFLLPGWGGGTVCPERTPYCVHHHVVNYGALWDGPTIEGSDGEQQPYDPPNDTFQNLPGNYWRDDLYLFVSTPGAPDPDLQAAYVELVRQYYESDYNKAVLWDPDIGK